MEPTTSTAGMSLTILAIAFLGPVAGPWTLIVFAALCGAMWPLSASKTETRLAGAGLLLLWTLTAVFLTGFFAYLVNRVWGLHTDETLAPVAFLIGAMGNGWRPVFSAIGDAIGALIGRAAGAWRKHP